jgi:hypothetical protein
MFAITTDTVCIGPGFATWAEAKAYKDEHQIEGVIRRVPSDTSAPNFLSSPEPQEMTASWARRMERAA